ncbi:MAG: transporter substrate-binding domain-containing protein [Ketobacteraceae bacterium]|nr:transporter substrate-binding domain-containing protein [Ketobacteraceae bacterium]
MIECPLAQADPVRLCGVEWPPFTKVREGKIVGGLSFDIYQEAFSRLGRGFVAYALPWPRCLRQVSEGNLDAVIDNDKLDPFIGGKHPTAVYPVAIYTRADHPTMAFSYQALEDKKVGMVRGYDYTPDIKQKMTWKPRYATDDQQLFRMLKAGRFDYVLADIFSAEIHAANAGLEVRRLEPVVDSTFLYLVFNARHAELVKQYDHVIGQMIEEGVLDKLYLRYLPFSYQQVLSLVNSDGKVSPEKQPDK